MARPKKTPEGDMSVAILADGVFIADDVRAAKGDKVTLAADIAETLIENGHARRV